MRVFFRLLSFSSLYHTTIRGFVSPVPERIWFALLHLVHCIPIPFILLLPWRADHSEVQAINDMERKLASINLSIFEVLFPTWA